MGTDAPQGGGERVHRGDHAPSASKGGLAVETELASLGNESDPPTRITSRCAPHDAWGTGFVWTRPDQEAIEFEPVDGLLDLRVPPIIRHVIPPHSRFAP